jgi:hypothetical protein
MCHSVCKYGQGRRCLVTSDPETAQTQGQVATFAIFSQLRKLAKMSVKEKTMTFEDLPDIKAAFIAPGVRILSCRLCDL